MSPHFTYIEKLFRQLYEVPDDLIIGYGDPQNKVNISPVARTFFDGEKDLAERQIARAPWIGRDLPFLFPGPSFAVPLRENRPGYWEITFDLWGAAFYFLSGWQERLFFQRHNALRFPYHHSLQQRLDIAHLPVVNYYFEVLKTAIEKALGRSVSRRRIWGEHPFAVCLTHDIDQATTGYRYDMASALRRGRLMRAAVIAAKRLAGQDSWDNIPDIIAMEREFGARSSFYFIARSGDIWHSDTYSRFNKGHFPPASEQAGEFEHFFSERKKGGYSAAEANADYHLNSDFIRRSYQAITASGNEIGIHGSFGSHLDAQRFREELERLNTRVKGGRFHFLYFDPLRSFDLLESAGLAYDSTMGFGEVPGFRHGFAFPFHPYNFKTQQPYRLLEIPLVAMDATFRTYLNMPLAEIPGRLSALMAETARFGGCFTVLWHNPYFTGDKYAGWREIYRGILEEGKSQGAGLWSGEQILAAWQR
ncbi:MAG: polysaccharide deacetylase family protein [Calditrichaeota bacterium]|nr:polysaccharide deacetylase family protein [Calditrichota bacterium]